MTLKVLLFKPLPLTIVQSLPVLSLCIYIYYTTAQPVYISVYSFYHYCAPVYQSIMFCFIYILFDSYIWTSTQNCISMS